MTPPAATGRPAHVPSTRPARRGPLIRRPAAALVTVLALALAVLLATAVSPASAPARAARAVPLSATWEFAEAGGTVAHDSYGGYDAVVDPRLPTVTLGLTDPVVGRYAHFDMGLLRTRASAALSPGTRDVSLRLQFRTTDPSGYANYLQVGTFANATGGFVKFETALRNGGAAPRCRFNGTGGTYLLMDTAHRVNDGRWHTVECAKTATGIQQVLDGVVTKERRVAVGSIDTGSEAVSIGGKYTPNTTVDPHDMTHGDIAVASYTLR